MYNRLYRGRDRLGGVYHSIWSGVTDESSYNSEVEPTGACHSGAAFARIQSQQALWQPMFSVGLSKANV